MIAIEVNSPLGEKCRGLVLSPVEAYKRIGSAHPSRFPPKDAFLFPELAFKLKSDLGTSLIVQLTNRFPFMIGKRFAGLHFYKTQYRKRNRHNGKISCNAVSINRVRQDRVDGYAVLVLYNFRHF